MGFHVSQSLTPCWGGAAALITHWSPLTCVTGKLLCLPLNERYSQQFLSFRMRHHALLVCIVTDALGLSMRRHDLLFRIPRHDWEFDRGRPTGGG